MMFEYIPQDRFIVNSLVRMIATADDEALAAKSYSTAIGCGVDEFVKHNMRLLSQQQLGISEWEDLLDEAVRHSADQLRRELDSHHLTFDFQPYFRHTRESLEEAAKEMTGLSQRLIESRERKRLREKTPAITADTRRRYDVSELGLLESIEGLLATPTPNVATLGIDKIKQTYRTEGEWFPFEVKVDNLLFVIDDDGTVFISTENFPDELIDRARVVLHQLAELLYS
jgi:hypothetical protein